MTVSSQDSRVSYDGDGITAIFPVPFYFLEDSHLRVLKVEDTTGVETVLVLNSDYTVTGAGNQAGGSITVPDEPTTSQRLVIIRSVPATQETDYVPNDPFPAESHERALDKLTMIAQQLTDSVSRALRVPDGDPEPNVLPPAADRANMVQAYDSTGQPVVITPASGSALDLSLALANNTDSTKGSSLVGFDPGLTGDVGRTVQSKLRESISVLDFGAVPGTGNSTAAFAAAITAAAAKGFFVHVPADPLGYTVGNLTLTTSIVGDGVASKINRLAGTTGNWLTVGANGVRITGLDIDAGWIAGNGIEINGFHNVEITNNVLQRIGGQIIHFNGANNLRIHFNHVPFATNGITNLMPVDSAAAVLSQGTSICNNILEGIAGSAIYLAGKQSSTDPLYYRSNRLIGDAVIMGNTLRDIAGHGILAQGRRVAIIGNNVLNVGNSSGLQGIVPQGDMVTVIGNVVEGGSGVGIDMGASINSTVVGNTVRNKLEIGIELNSCTNVTCSGNTVESCGSSVAGTNSAGISVSQGFFGPTLKSFAISVNGNTVTAGAAGGKYGISVDSGVQDVIVSGNHLTASGTIAPIFVDEASNARATCYGNVTGDNEDGFFVMYGTDSRVIVRKPGGNADLPLYPEGSGQLKLGKFMTNAATPASFQAKAYFQIKDQGGNVFYVPVTNTVW